MTTTVPVSHLEEGQKLTAEAEVDLFQINLRNHPVVFRFRDGPDITWMGNFFEGMGCTMSGDSRTAEGEESRPSLRVLNPHGIFNEAAINHMLDYATVTRWRVLRQHLENNVNIYQRRRWYIGRVRELISGQMINLELRNLTEGANFQIPARMYIPPEYPVVSL